MVALIDGLSKVEMSVFKYKLVIHTLAVPVGRQYWRWRWPASASANWRWRCEASASSDPPMSGDNAF